jgi:hypothetical protein
MRIYQSEMHESRLRSSPRPQPGRDDLARKTTNRPRAAGPSIGVVIQPPPCCCRVNHYQVASYCISTVVTALFESRTLRSLEGPDQLPADPPFPEYALHLYLVE